MIQIINGYKSYDKNKTYVLKNINLEIPMGKMIAITGESGSGKSTLLNLISGFEKVTEGKIIVDNTNITNFNDKEQANFRRNNIGFIFQDYYLLPYLNCIENIMFPALSVKSDDYLDKMDKAKKLLKKMRIEKLENMKVNKLSGGEKQRISIIRALINAPQVILADEPTGNLDHKNAKSVFEVLRKTQEEENITVIIVTHNKELSDLCDIVYEINNGNIIKVKN